MEDEISPAEAVEAMAEGRRVCDAEEQNRNLERIDKVVSSPDDRHANIWCNLYRCVQSIPPEFLEQMRKQLQADLAAGKLRFPAPGIYQLKCQPGKRHHFGA